MQKVKVEQIKDTVKIDQTIWIPMQIVEIDPDYKWPITVHHSGENQTVNLHLIDTVCIENSDPKSCELKRGDIVMLIETGEFMIFEYEDISEWADNVVITKEGTKRWFQRNEIMLYHRPDSAGVQTLIESPEYIESYIEHLVPKPNNK